MKKLIILNLLGFIPLFIGIIMNYIIMQDVILSFNLIGFIFIILWIFVGYKTEGIEETPAKTSISIHIPAAFALILVLFQELILGQYWFNILGMLTQLFFLPLISIGSYLTFWTPRIWPVYIVAFLIMLGSYYIGIRIKKRRQR